jgi:hypothetical protein
MATYVRTQEIEHDIGDAGSFVLRVTSADVEVRGTEATTAHLRATFELRASSEAEADQLFDQAQLQVTAGDGVLEAAEPRDLSSAIASLTRLFGERGGLRRMRVEAEIPHGAQVRLVGVSGDMTATGLSGPQQYQTVSGDLVLTDASDGIRVKSVSGNVVVRGDETLELDASTVSGDLYVSAAAIDRLVVSSVSGGIEVDGGLAAGAPYRIETVSGDFRLGTSGHLTLEVRGLSTAVDITLPHRAEGSRDRRRYVIGGGGAHLTFSSMSGDVSVSSSRRAPPTRQPSAPLRAPDRPGAAAAQTPDGGSGLEILRALERGEIDVDDAARRLSREP